MGMLTLVPKMSTPSRFLLKFLHEKKPCASCQRHSVSSQEGASITHNKKDLETYRCPADLTDVHMRAQSLSRVLLFCNPMDCSPPGSSVHGISQPRILEQVATSFSRRSSPTQGSNPSLLHWQVDSLPLLLLLLSRFSRVRLCETP